jgi:hypothetical protein
MTAAASVLRRRASALALAAAAAGLLGCAHGRIQEYANQVETRFMGAPAAQALKELGPPKREQANADLRSYFWETGEIGEPGGNCRLRLVADPRGTVVDYTIDGTPLGCHRILTRA